MWSTPSKHSQTLALKHLESNRTFKDTLYKGKHLHIECKQKKRIEVTNGAKQLKMCKNSKLFHTLSDMDLLSTQFDRDITNYIENVYLLHKNYVLR